MADAVREYLELADWRRRVAAMWEAWRSGSGADPVGATAAFRAAKDELFRTHPQSPLPDAFRAAFEGLPYWPYDAAYRLTVRVEPGNNGGSLAGPHDEEAGLPAGGPGSAGSLGAMGGPLGSIALPNSGAQAVAFRRIGQALLSGPLAGQRLSVFWIEGYGGGLFLPLRDATSGAETYGAGRYLLDTIKSADHGGDAERQELILDFNLAYHPSCAYDPRWSCPLAPPENRLNVPIRVGERLR